MLAISDERERFHKMFDGVLNTSLIKIHSVTLGKMRQRGIMRQLPCFELQNQRRREPVKPILLHGNLRLYF